MAFDDELAVSGTAVLARPNRIDEQVRKVGLHTGMQVDLGWLENDDLDARTGQVEDANPFLTELLGYTRAELLGKPLWEIRLFSAVENSRIAFRLVCYHERSGIPMEIP